LDKYDKISCEFPDPRIRVKLTILSFNTSFEWFPSGEKPGKERAEVGEGGNRGGGEEGKAALEAPLVWGQGARRGRQEKQEDQQRRTAEGWRLGAESRKRSEKKRGGEAKRHDVQREGGEGNQLKEG
jgi:hypothetical protein